MAVYTDLEKISRLAFQSMPYPDWFMACFRGLGFSGGVPKFVDGDNKGEPAV